MGLGGFFKKLGSFGVRVFKVAQANGLTDDLVKRTVGLVSSAQAQFASNETRREWVVSGLVAGGVKENVARLAVELAVQALKTR